LDGEIALLEDRIAPNRAKYVFILTGFLGKSGDVLEEKKELAG